MGVDLRTPPEILPRLSTATLAISLIGYSACCHLAVMCWLSSSYVVGLFRGKGSHVYRVQCLLSVVAELFVIYFWEPFFFFCLPRFSEAVVSVSVREIV